MHIKQSIISTWQRDFMKITVKHNMCWDVHEFRESVYCTTFAACVTLYEFNLRKTSLLHTYTQFLTRTANMVLMLLILLQYFVTEMMMCNGTKTKSIAIAMDVTITAHIAVKCPIKLAVQYPSSSSVSVAVDSLNSKTAALIPKQVISIACKAAIKYDY